MPTSQLQLVLGGDYLPPKAQNNPTSAWKDDQQHARLVDWIVDAKAVHVGKGFFVANTVMPFEKKWQYVLNAYRKDAKKNKQLATQLAKVGNLPSNDAEPRRN